MINTFFSPIQPIVSEKNDKPLIIPPPITLQLRGAIIPVIITHPKSIADELLKQGNKVIPTMQINALIDTGASGSAITPNVAETLKLVQTGFQSITSVQDEQLQPAYYAAIRFQWGRGKEVQVFSCPLKGFDCIIGRDILMHWNFIYNGVGGFITICD
jgi:predicted aspartyl protease